MHPTRHRSMPSCLAAVAVIGSVAGLLLADGGAIAQPEWKEVPLKDGTYRQYKGTHRTDTVDIPVRPNGGEIEYMVQMKQGESLVYSWRAVGYRGSGEALVGIPRPHGAATGNDGHLDLLPQGNRRNGKRLACGAVRRHPWLVSEERYRPAAGRAADLGRVLRGYSEPASLSRSSETSAGCGTASSARRGG